MPTIQVRADTLDVENARFAQTPLREPVFLNSVPKSGSHLLRNIMRMFVPVDQHYMADFIQWGNLPQHRHAFDPARPMLSWGHLFMADASVVETARTRRVVLYRDPYDWVIARARFLHRHRVRAMPVDANASKLLRFGTQLVSLGGGARYWFESSRAGAEGFGLRFTVTLLFPR